MRWISFGVGPAATTGISALQDTQLYATPPSPASSATRTTQLCALLGSAMLRVGGAAPVDEGRSFGVCPRGTWLAADVTAIAGSEGGSGAACGNVGKGRCDATGLCGSSGGSGGASSGLCGDSPELCEDVVEDVGAATGACEEARASWFEACIVTDVPSLHASMARARASFKASQEGYRSSGFLANALVSTARSGAGQSAGKGTGDSMICIASRGILAGNGTRPNKSWYSTTPRL